MLIFLPVVQTLTWSAKANSILSEANMRMDSRGSNNQNDICHDRRAS